MRFYFKVSNKRNQEKNLTAGCKTGGQVIIQTNNSVID